MSNAGLLCRREVVICSREDSVFEASLRMRDFHVGDVIVVDGPEGRRVPVGILTDRDIAMRIVAAGRNPKRERVGDLMSTPLVTAREDELLDDILPRMRAHGIRRLVVVDDRRVLQGILTLDDLLELIGEELTGFAKLVRRELKREEERYVNTPLH